MNNKATKNKIIETMYNLIAEKGYDKTSIGQIAEAIGIKKASIYYYFSSKEDIFLQIVKDIYNEDYLNRENLFKGKITIEYYQKTLITMGEQFIDSYFANHNLRKVCAEIDIQISRINGIGEIVKIADEKFNKFLIHCIEIGVEICAFPKNIDITLNAQIIYTVLIGIDQGILYDLPINPKKVWKEVILKLFEIKEA